MPTYADVGLTTDGDWPLQPRLITGLELIGQRIQVALQLHVGEYLLDTREGVPWLDWMQIKPPPLSSISAGIRSTILGVRGVQSISDYQATFTAATETLAITVTVLTDEGELEIGTKPRDGRALNQAPQWYWFSRSGPIAPL